MPTITPENSAPRQTRRPMRTPFLVIWAILALAAMATFLSLGQWQLERRAWKHDLISRVEARLQAAPTAAPANPEWANITQRPDDYEYRRVHITGQLLSEKSALVQASTVIGPGYWVLTPLQTQDGTIVMINRGFVPLKQPEGPWRQASPAETVTLTGLLRLSEPSTGFLRDNDPAGDRWYSRDVQQIANSRGLVNAAPFFIDADATETLPVEWTMEPPVTLPEARLPVGGLTVVSFPDKHMVYAITWYGLALMLLVAAIYVLREEYRLRRHQKNPTLGDHEYDDEHH